VGASVLWGAGRGIILIKLWLGREMQLKRFHCSTASSIEALEAD